MVRKDYTDITVIMDRSGSMANQVTDAEGGLQHFIDQQKVIPGECRFSLVQFNNTYEVVHSGVPIDYVPRCTLHPSGGTALLDAVGRTIVETGSRLAKLRESDRPGAVIILIITDGAENASYQYKLSQIKEMISRQREVYDWQFIFLGANEDAFLQAQDYGIPMAASGVFVNYLDAYDYATKTSGAIRQASIRGLSLSAANTMTDEVRAELKADVLVGNTP